MAHQSSKEQAHPVSFQPINYDEIEQTMDTLPSEYQPVGVDDEEPQYESLEEALTA